MSNRYSYSKLSTLDQCGWRYYLTYILGHYTYSDSLETEWGTLVHHTEEMIGKAIKAGLPIPYDKLKDDFLHINIPKKNKYDTEGGIFGVDTLKKKYPLEFVTPNENGQTYTTKTEYYLNYGIYRLERYMKDNPDLEIYDLEKPFSYSFDTNILGGFIDRIFHNKATGEYIIEDIKTKDKLFKDDLLVTPLQFVVYALALQDTLGEDVKLSCAYDLPFCDCRQAAGSERFIKRGVDKIKSLFGKEASGDFAPNPSPLCAWCSFSPTSNKQPEEAKGLCPYHSLWTRAHKTFAVAHKWEGMDKHEQVMKRIRVDQLNEELGIDFDF